MNGGDGQNLGGMSSEGGIRQVLTCTSLQGVKSKPQKGTSRIEERLVKMNNVGNLHCQEISTISHKKHNSA